MQDLMASAKPYALFYFAEPTPWQLHHLRNHVQVRKVLPSTLNDDDDKVVDAATAPRHDYIWLDSSMNQSADLQAMDGRLGPGTLLARKL